MNFRQVKAVKRDRADISRILGISDISHMIMLSRTPFSVDLKINENKLSIYVLDSSYVPLILNVFIL